MEVETRYSFCSKSTTVEELDLIKKMPLGTVSATYIGLESLGLCSRRS